MFSRGSKVGIFLGGIENTSFPFSAAGIDADFANSRFFGGTLANLFTFTNSTGGYASDNSGKLINFAANTPRITNQGWLIEAGATNLSTQSNFISSWSNSASTKVANAATSPDGTTNAATL